MGYFRQMLFVTLHVALWVLMWYFLDLFFLPLKEVVPIVAYGIILAVIFVIVFTIAYYLGASDA